MASLADVFTAKPSGLSGSATDDFQNIILQGKYGFIHQKFKIELKLYMLIKQNLRIKPNVKTQVYSSNK